MKNTITHLIDKISFQAQTTILVWIIVIGFTLIASVGLLALMGIKSEFDINSSQSHNMYTLTLLNKAYDIHKNDQILLQLLEIWEQYKTYNLPKDQNSTISHLREWYAKTFKMHYYQQIQRLLSKENALIESIDKAFINDGEDISSLLEEQFLISFDIAFYGKKITDSLYKNTFIVLAIFMLIIIATIIILAFSIRQSINTNHLLLEQLVQSKTKELQSLNVNLQKSIEYEVEQNRKKDLIMYQQARLASMGEMIQNIAHQWRQPLNSLMILIQSFKSRAMQKKLDNEFINQQTQYGMKIATEMSNTIENFRNFFHPETNKEFFELSQSIRNSIELLKAQFQENLIRIEVDVSPQAQDLNMLGYQNSFTQVILILINNAIDALKLKSQNDKSFENPLIEISLDKLGYNIILCVKDNAGGIDLEDKSKVFEPYFTTKHKSVGTGVGLYMAKQIIERQLNGTISVSNTQWGKQNQYFGAEFTIHIPIQKDNYES
ncbi:two-component sensor histidine kinase family protein [Helicobacter hepaticus ATCC 51449]|uniref:histidine kinase n=1 Tax=Helicobacter hepaticus (strain ATCC 51449 / 3B1) TaxID=235279 RepID=Q7VK71_HELHP|nr:HAMP domain-containing sensor histidine kinase [Helicobacter hepaticus]AAP76618.1 two-component sensor histidine kinase family protein [Helicobacter hepaticus ATCC 51449]